MRDEQPIFADVLKARKAIAGLAIRTPMVRSKLSELLGVELWMKLETLQPTGAFKIRGASNALLALDDEQRRLGVVCCSTGNHGRAVAYAAARLGIPTTVCLSTLVPANKVHAIEALGATVLRVGKSQDEAQEEAWRLVADAGLTDIAPFDNADVIAGQGTVGFEMLEAVPELDTLLVPLSGGGLLAGVALAAKAMKPDIRILGLSMDRGAAMAASLTAGTPVPVVEAPSLADSLGGGIGLNNRFTFAIAQALLDDVVLLTEQEIYRGMQALFYEERIVSEGAAAIAHAAILAHKVTLSGATGLIISGNNVDMDQFMRVVRGRSLKVGEIQVAGIAYERGELQHQGVPHE